MWTKLFLNGDEYKGSDSLTDAAFVDCRTSVRVAEAASRHSLLARLEGVCGGDAATPRTAAPRGRDAGHDTASGHAGAFGSWAAGDQQWADRLLERVSAIKDLQAEGSA